jgi:hypothetical protein
MRIGPTTSIPAFMVGVALNVRPFLVSTIAALLLSFACTTSNAARRIGGSPYDGTWSVTIYTLRGNCGSVRAAVRIVGGRVYSEDQSRVVRDKAPRTRSAVSEGRAG